MRFLFTVLIFLSANAFAKDDLELRFPVTKYKLANGLTVLLYEDHRVPMISYHTWYKVGSRDEREGITGSAHMLEHMMFQGAKKYPAKEGMKVLDQNGVDWNAFTTNEFTGFYMNLPSSKLELVMDVEFDRMSSLAIDPQILKSEKQVVAEERRMRYDNSPPGLLYERTVGTVFKTSNHHWPVIGWMKDIEQYNDKVLREFYRKFYGPNNAVLVIAGDFEPEALKKLIDKYYGRLEAAPMPERRYPAEDKQIQARIEMIPKDVQAISFNIAFPGSGALNKDMYALDILATIMGTGSSSRLYKKLVYDMKIASSAGAFHRSWQELGMFAVSVNMKPGQPMEKAAAVVREELNRFQKEKVSAAELKKAKIFVMKGSVDGLTTLDRKARALASAEIINGSYESLFTDLEKYQAVTAEDIQRCARAYLKPEAQNTVALIPQPAVKK